MSKHKQRRSGGGSGKPTAGPRPEPLEAVTASPSADACPASQYEPVALPAPLPNATTLLDEVQQRCEKLRQWQRDTQASLQARAVEVERRERLVDDIQRQAEAGRARLELDQDALKRARLMLDKERAQNEQSQQAVEAERARLERARAELNDQKHELAQMRYELDAEWASLSRVRRAQESLAAALDADRTRVQELRMNDSLARVGIDPPNPDAGSNDKPGLSLTQAA